MSSWSVSALVKMKAAFGTELLNRDFVNVASDLMCLVLFSVTDFSYERG